MSLTASFKLSDDGTLQMLSASKREFSINPQGLRQGAGRGVEQQYQCSADEMMEFNTIGRGASSVVRKAIHVPTHRFVALKVINIFDKDKRQQLLNELKVLVDGGVTPVRGLISYAGAYYSPDTNQISVAMEYMEGGSLEGLLQRTGGIPEDVLSRISRDVLDGLSFLHRERHMVHRDIKPANILVNLAGEAKITDFGISTGLDNTLAMCNSYKGTMCYMSPERIRNEAYTFTADIWSLGLTLVECATGAYPYSTDQSPVGTMMEIMESDAPTPPQPRFSAVFADFVAACLHKDPLSRPSASVLLKHPFAGKGAVAGVDMAAYMHNVIDLSERLLSLAQMFVAHYYTLFDQEPAAREALGGLYLEADSVLSLDGRRFRGRQAITSELKTVEHTSHTAGNIDCQPYMESGCLMLVTGRVRVGGSPTPRSFSEMFVLLPGAAGAWFVSNQARHLLD